ncbi:UDP-N-acetylglucosamine 2-epimerase (non-hydrolyzing) [Candidatus Woesearchaeota archaeon]|nr:UDP-N-acetylglucosamine 2-epimerase (non-hydrolyzing) [Candidatus Woesearchaeota archaeon]
MKVVTILGTRPEIIKLSPLLPLLDAEFDQVVIHTNQHYDYEMDGTFFKDLQLPQVKYNLNVGSHQQGKQVGLMLEKIENILKEEKPDVVIVQGDTNTTLAGALAAAKVYIPLVHVEAGCRSFNKKMPEEINRIVADRCADYFFAADQGSVDNLAQEGITKNVFLVGNTIFDAVVRNKKLAEKSTILGELGITEGNYVLATIHRQQSTTEKKVLENIMTALGILAEKMPVVFPLHPGTKKALEKHHIKPNQRIKIIKSQEYLPFLKLLAHCRFCITDSGGIQDEALVFNVPALIPRYETEWMRLVNAGKNFLVGNTTESILIKAQQLVNDDRELQRIKAIKCPYETGAAEKIVQIMKEKIRKELP